MRFEEFREKCAKYYAYSNWMTVADAKLVGMIPEQYADAFDDLCECGSDNIVAPNLRREMCCNPRCRIKEGHKLAEMFSRFGELGLGYMTCSHIYNVMKDLDAKLKTDGKEGLFIYNTFTEVLMVPWEKYPMSVQNTASGLRFFEACMRIRNHRMTFGQLVGYLGLTNLGSNAEKIFEGINSYKEWRDIVLSCGGIINFCTRRGISSPEVVYNIASSIEDIAVAEFACSQSLRKTGQYKMSVCITGSVVCNGIRMTKAKFIDACNELCVAEDGTALLEVKSVSGPVTVPFVIYTTPSGSSKYNVGQSRGWVTDDLGKHEVLITASDFYNWLKEAMNEWNRKMDLDWLTILSTVLQRMISSKMILQN